jgi:hypothetical protein
MVDLFSVSGVVYIYHANVPVFHLPQQPGADLLEGLIPAPVNKNLIQNHQGVLGIHLTVKTLSCELDGKRDFLVSLCQATRVRGVRMTDKDVYKGLLQLPLYPSRLC